MKALFLQYKTKIDEYLTSFLSGLSTQVEQTNPWQNDVYTRLLAFITRGKSIRGCLFLWAKERYCGSLDDEDYKQAASFELIHGGFLVHDDIMDNDRFRRGSPSLFTQYEEEGRQRNVNNPEDFGKSMAICVGDLAFFLGMKCSSTNKTVAAEFASVCVAQMQDLALGATTQIPTEEEVLSLYTYKTARYTISLPLCEGARSAGASISEINTLADLGEKMGVVFQLTDDVLNLFGMEELTGKSVGSDIREEKKTYAFVLLQSLASSEERAKLNSMKDLEIKVAYTLELMKTHKIQMRLQTYIHSLSGTIENLINALALRPEYKAELKEFYNNLTRRSS